MSPNTLDRAFKKIAKRSRRTENLRQIIEICDGLRDDLPVYPEPFLRIDDYNCFTPEDAIGVTPGQLTVAFVDPYPFIAEFPVLSKVLKQACSFHEGKVPRPALVIEITATQVKISLQLIVIEHAFTHISAELELGKEDPSPEDTPARDIQLVRRETLNAVHQKINNGAIYPWFMYDQLPSNFFWSPNGAEIVHHATLLAISEVSWLLLQAPVESRTGLKGLKNVRIQPHKCKSREEYDAMMQMLQETSAELLVLDRLVITEVQKGNRVPEMLTLRNQKIRELRENFKKPRWANKNQKGSQSGLGHYPQQTPAVIPISKPLGPLGRNNIGILREIVLNAGGSVTINKSDYPIFSRKNGNHASTAT